MMKIGMASDHAGFEYKSKLITLLRKKGFEVVDFGTDSPESCDYPDYAHPLASAVEQGQVDCGIALCGTGNGMAITLNKHRGIRAGLCWNSEVARLIRAHNDGNILVMPARFISYAMVTRIVNTWFSTSFDGGRHQRRINKIPTR
ncbi:MAG: ribose 5-phosphate isomerase B [Candidatus Cryptobacteroides sp.]